MQIERLEYFIKVADAQSINSASNDLHISQQALNQSMTNLEKELGVSLFIRSNRGIMLTDKGKEFYSVAFDIVEKWNNFKTFFYQENNLHGHYTIGIFPYIEVDYYSIFMTSIEKNYPKIEIDTIIAFNEELITMLENKKIDIAITNFKENETYRPPNPSLEFFVLNKKKIDVIVSLNSPLANYSSISFADLQNYPIALQQINCNDEYNILIQKLKENHCNNIFFYNSIYTVKRMVEKGVAVSFNTVGSNFISKSSNKFVSRSLKEDFYMVKVVVFHKDAITNDSVLSKLIEEICIKLKD